jgi:(p)ppGpp synthase/HD superfamily hydrolase
MVLIQFARRACTLTGCSQHSSRIKKPSSIIRKMNEGRTIDDVLGVRLVHPNPKEAHVKLSSAYPDVILKRDYISHPKEGTMYQALHLTMTIPPWGYPVEVQIQTREMYDRALVDGYHDHELRERTGHHQDKYDDQD